MKSLFYTNIYASILILFVFLIRCVWYHKLPKNLFAALWKIIIIRLLFLWEIPICVANEEKIKIVTEQINIVTSALPLDNMHIIQKSSDIFLYVRIAVTLGLAVYVCAMYIMNTIMNHGNRG